VAADRSAAPTYYELLEAAERVTDAARKAGEDPRDDGVFADAVVDLWIFVTKARKALVPPGPPASPRWPGREAMRG
jgi:hypothetical protein